MARSLGAGGSERQMAELAVALDPAEFAVHVGCFYDHGVRASELRSRGVPVLRLPVRSFLNFSAARGAWVLGRYVRRNRIQLVHTFDLPLTCFGVPVSRAFGVPFVLSSQRAHRALHPRARSVIRLTDRMVDGIVVNCEAMRRHMVEEGASPELIHVCPNWIDTARYRPQQKLRPGGLAGAALIIGVVCMLRPEKDLETLVEAFARVACGAPGLILLVVGSGPMLGSLQDQARRLGVLPQCVFQPEVSDVTPWLREIDIFVLPSTTEALSNSLMEAMACGCCPIASRVGGNPELIEDGVTGLLFRAGDAEDLAGKLRSLIADQSARSALSAKAVSFIRERFDHRVLVGRMAGVYRSYLSGASLRGAPQRRL
ncbi:MAG TPA: glycosyltransferase family 4 protein [Bryobacteraceae bacterium]|nr:glycosyltransferase family 4 protein [Bryobacteraceae bacterium]